MSFHFSICEKIYNKLKLNTLNLIHNLNLGFQKHEDTLQNVVGSLLGNEWVVIHSISTLNQTSADLV